MANVLFSLFFILLSSCHIHAWARRPVSRKISCCFGLPENYTFLAGSLAPTSISAVFQDGGRRPEVVLPRQFSVWRACFLDRWRLLEVGPVNFSHWTHQGPVRKTSSGLPSVQRSYIFLCYFRLPVYSYNFGKFLYFLLFSVLKLACVDDRGSILE